MAFAQKFVGIGTEKPTPRAVLELKVEDPATFQQGFLPPKLTTGQRVSFGAILAGTTLTGMTVYDTALNQFFYWDGSQWSQLAIASGTTNLTALGLGGIGVTTSGLGFTVDGSNFVKITDLLSGDLTGNAATGYTVTGINRIPVDFTTPIGNGQIMVYTTTGNKFSPYTIPAAVLTTVQGINGVVINQIGQGFTIDGSNLVKTNTAAFGNVSGDFTTGLTVTGLQGIGFSGAAAAGDILSFNGINFVFTPLPTSQTTNVYGTNNIGVSGTYVNGFTVDGSNLVHTITGGIGVTISTITGGFNVDVASAPVTSISGINGALISQNGQGFTVDGSNLVQTITGGVGVTISTITGGFNVDVAQQAMTSVVGTAGLTVNSSGASVTVSGVGLVLAAQSLTNPVGSAVVSGFGSNSLFKMPITIPLGAKKINISVNAYLTDGGTTGDLRFDIIGASSGPFNITGVTSTSPDNITTISALDISDIATGTTVMLKVYGGNVGPSGEGIMLQGFVIKIVE